MMPRLLPIALCAWSVFAHAGTFAEQSRLVDRTARSFQSYDRDQDGTAEIVSLKPLAKAAAKGRGYVVVLVQTRLSKALARQLKTFAGDIAKDGDSAFVLETSFYNGPAHQDGLTGLAYRDFLRRLWLKDRGLKGAVLVGNWPQPFMVRLYWWLRDDPVTLYEGTKAAKSFQRQWVRNIAEPVVSPADIVLADLDGGWDSRYFKHPVNLAQLRAVFPAGSDVTEDWEVGQARYEDFFFVNDGVWSQEPREGRKARFVYKGESNDECSAEDLKRANPMALPEIAISRINAYHAAVVPDPTVRDKDGRKLLDAGGRPQALEFASLEAVPKDIWVYSEAEEVKLLNEYFARNHAYRSGKFKHGMVPASVSQGLGEGISQMKAFIPGWAGLDPSSKEYLRDATLTELAEWFKKPAVVREIRAHSNPVISEFGAPKSVDELEKASGGAYFWTRNGNRLEPSLKGVGGLMGFGFLRTLYENHAVPDPPCLYFHNGCEAMRPVGAEDLPFNAAGYGRNQLAECLMMYANGLAVVGRGKVFYDEPRDFWKTLGAGGTWGEAWRTYFEVESKDAQLAKDGIGRKRAYFWSLLGDFTLRLPKELLAPSSKALGR